MSYIFRDSDFSDFLAAASQTELNIDSAVLMDPGQIRLQTPKGEISYQEYRVKPELSILQGNYQLHDDITIYGKGDSNLLEMHFNLSDRDIPFLNNALKRKAVPAMSGNLTFLTAAENKAKISFDRNENYHTFDIHLPLSFFSAYAGESKMMDTFLSNINNQQSTTLSPYEIKINPRIYSTIQAIRNCSFEGLTKKIYLESKIYELIALVHEGSESFDSGYRITAADRERIKYAGVLIQENLDKPFTIVALARRVGINQTKLKSGFKAVFGTTVFGYLQQTRMHMASELLLDTNLSIQHIGNLSGYKSISNFSTAFKQIHGYPPNKLRR